jgi:hypothetical protein
MNYLNNDEKKANLVVFFRVVKIIYSELLPARSFLTVVDK